MQSYGLKFGIDWRMIGIKAAKETPTRQAQKESQHQDRDKVSADGSAPTHVVDALDRHQLQDKDINPDQGPEQTETNARERDGAKQAQDSPRMVSGAAMAARA